MTTQEFLIELRRLDVDLWLEGDRVRCSAPPDVLTAERRAELARRKTEIEALLKVARAAAPGSIVPNSTRARTSLPVARSCRAISNAVRPPRQ